MSSELATSEAEEKPQPHLVLPTRLRSSATGLRSSATEGQTASFEPSVAFAPADTVGAKL